MAARHSEWNTALLKGRARGIAFAEAFETLLAQVVEISVDDQKVIHVRRAVTVAILARS